MSRPVFGTLSQLARFRGVDVRNRLLQNLTPYGFLQAGQKLLPIFELTDAAQQQVATSATKPKE